MKIDATIKLYEFSRNRNIGHAKSSKKKSVIMLHT